MTGALALPTSPPARSASTAPERPVPPPTVAERIAPAEFSAFYERVAPRLWGYVQTQVRNPTQTDDLVQEAFTRVLAARFEPENEEHLTRYLYRTAIHLIRDRGRSKNRAHDTLDDHPEPAQPAAPEGLRHDLGVAFDALNERERKLLWLAHIEGLDHKAIADAVGAQAGSVRVMLFRARRRLAERLGLEKRENRSST